MTDNQQKVLYEVVPENEIILPAPKEWLCAYHPVQYIYLRPVAALSAPAGEREGVKDWDLIEDAMNAYGHEANRQLEKKDLGDIERKNWESVHRKVKDFFSSTTPPTGKAAGVWVKASERMPEERNIYFVKQVHKKHGIEDGVFKSTRIFDPVAKWESGFEGEHDWYEVVEWLDQSAQPSETGEGKFAEWASKRDDIYYDSDLKLWVDKYTNHITTSELYQLYLSTEREK